jgi:hypothetical protein
MWHWSLEWLIVGNKERKKNKNKNVEHQTIIFEKTNKQT